MTIFNYEGWRFYFDKDKGEYWPLKADNTPKQSAGAKFQWYLTRFKRLSAAERVRYVEKYGECMICPDCKGNKIRGPVHVNYGFDGSIGGCRGEYKMINCYRCNATGKVPEEMAEWIKSGRRMRDCRVKNHISVSDAAKNLGITAAQYSEIERGLVPS